MKTIVLLAALLTAAPAVATTPTPVPPPAPAPVAAPAVAPKFSSETPIETIAADPAGKAFLEANMADLLKHAMYDQFKSMSLKQLAPMSGGKITDEVLAKVDAGLAAIK